MTGFEPATPWSQTKCSTKLSHFPNMVRPKGFEPLTFWFVAKHSIQLSYERIYAPNLSKKSNGGFGQNRTADTRIFSPLLYRLSYEAKNKMAVPTGFEPAIFCVTGRRDNHYTTGPFGCGRWIWTNDLRVMSPTSYQAAPFRDIIIIMAEKEGFEPPRRCRPAGFQDRYLQPDLVISPHYILFLCFFSKDNLIIAYKIFKCQQ